MSRRLKVRVLPTDRAYREVVGEPWMCCQILGESNPFDCGGLAEIEVTLKWSTVSRNVSLDKEERATICRRCAAELIADLQDCVLAVDGRDLLTMKVDS